MSKNIEVIISNMVQLLNEQKGKKFNVNSNYTSFRYTGNIKTETDIDKLGFNPSISIFGDDVQRFDNLYFELYSELKVEKKKVSFEQFKNDSQDLFFFLPTEEQFRDLITNKYQQSETFYYIAPIYGIVCRDDVIDFGEAIFVSGRYLKTYIDNLTNVKHKELFMDHLNDNVEAHLLYFVRKYQCFDPAFTRDSFFQDLDEMINILRFLCGSKSDRIYIDKIKLDSNAVKYIALSKTSFHGSTSIINMHDIPIQMEKSWFDNNYAKKIMNIACNANKTDLEQRIIRSLVWCGRSIEEYYLDLSCTEIAIAFESIFKSNKDRLITQSIQDQIAESTALILKNNYDEVMEIIMELKKLYSLRSAIAHGYQKRADIETYNKSLEIFRKTIIKLLEDDNYSNCINLDELKDLLDNRKYS